MHVVRTPNSPPSPPRLERRAILLGVLISCVLAVTIVIAGLKAGITPGVSPLVVLVAWAVFARSLRGKNATVVLNLAQVAGSAGVAVTAGIIFTAPLLPILSHAQGLPYHGLPLFKLIIASLAGALIGYGYVGLNARRVLSDATLPAPEARACEAMVRIATHHYDEPNDPQSADGPPQGPDGRVLDTQKPRLSRSLIPGIAHGILAPSLAAMGVCASHIMLFSRDFVAGGRHFEVNLPYMPIYFGIGGLLQLGTAFAAFMGTLVRLCSNLELGMQGPSAMLWPDTSLRWIGGGAMTVAVLWSILRLAFRTRLQRENAPEDIHPHTLIIGNKARRGLLSNIALGSVLLLAGIVYLGGWGGFSFLLAATVTILAAFMVALGAFLSLQIGSSASPVSGAVFLMTLVLCVLALVAGRGQTPADLELMTLVLVTACVAVCASNDTSQDYRTMQLCDVPISRGFSPHWLGLVSASIVVPIAVVLAEHAYGLGTRALPAPQGQLFATLVQGMLFEHALPWRPIALGVFIGLLAVGFEIAQAKKGRVVPAMAFAIGLYLPAELGIGLLLGALARYAGDRSRIERPESILTAGGLITGAAFFDLLIGITMFAGLSPNIFHIVDVPHTLQYLIAACGIFWILWLLYRSARGPRMANPPDASPTR